MYWYYCTYRRKAKGPSIQELIEKEYNSELIGQLR